MVTNSIFYDYFRLLKVIDIMYDKLSIACDGQKREFDYAKSDRLLFFSVFKENNEFFYSDLHLFGLEPPR